MPPTFDSLDNRRGSYFNQDLEANLWLNGAALRARIDPADVILAMGVS